MEQVSPTRMNLITRKAQIKLAKQGVDLLKNKRDALIKEFFELVKPVVGLRKKLEAKQGDARWKLFLALSAEGPERLGSVSLACHRDFQIELERRNLWGIRVADVKKKPVMRGLLERGYAITGTGFRIDEAARSFEELLDSILELAPIETKLKKLGEEIKKTSRRVNALEQRLIPRLNAEKRYIQQVLEEREREDIFRLKRIKGKR